MHKVACLLLCLTTNIAWSADLTEVRCGQCRDVYEHPQDYGNFAYNQVFGSNPTLSFAQGDIMKVVSPSGQWAVVDLNFVSNQTGLSFSIYFLYYSLAVPNGRIQMVVQDPKGNITEFQAYALSPDLEVGGGTSPPTQSEPEPEPEDPTPVKSNTAGGGQEIICCQSGAFYWYYDQPAFSMQFGNE
jgi:hypothetical protein